MSSFTKPKIIELKQTVQCSQDEMWAKWTTGEGLKTFFGADNNIALKNGGPYEVFFLLDAPEGSRGGEGNKIISFLLRKQLSFTWNAPPQFPEVRDHLHKTWVLLTFNEKTASSTEVVLSHAGWLEGEQWDLVFEYFSQAWPSVLSGLVACFQDRLVEPIPEAKIPSVRVAKISPHLQSPAQKRGEQILQQAKEGADMMRNMAFEMSTDKGVGEILVRADDIERQAVMRHMSLLTNGYEDEHH